MVTFKGQKRERKDATFQPAYEPGCIATGEHNGQIGVRIAEPADVSLQFAQQAIMDAGKQRTTRISAHERGLFRWFHQG